MGIQLSKHKILSKKVYTSIYKGPVLFENNLGKVQTIYAFETIDRVNNNVYAYLFSIDKEGRFIDSIYLTNGDMYIAPDKSKSLSWNKEISIYDNKFHIVNEGGCEGNSIVIGYIITPQLKIKKVSTETF